MLSNIIYNVLSIKEAFQPTPNIIINLNPSLSSILQVIIEDYPYFVTKTV